VPGNGSSSDPAGWGAALDFEDVSGETAITGIGEADHSNASGRTTREIAGQAIERALQDAGLEPSEVDGIMYTDSVADQFTDDDYRAHFGTSHDMWVSRRGGGMHWAGSAPYEAALAIREGRARHVINTFAVAWASQRGEMTGGPGQAHAEMRLKRQLEVAFGFFPQPVYAAAIARRHMFEYGTREEDLGMVAVTHRRHANQTPGAILGDRALTLDDYLAAPTLADPLRKYDCCLISDGGGAYIVSSTAAARDLRPPVIRIAGVGEGHFRAGHFTVQHPTVTATPHLFSAPAAFQMAGCSAADVDVLTCYDPFTIIPIMTLEDMGFCEKGEGGGFVADGGIGVAGATPLNPHGGLLSHAYVLGIAHVCETVRQLRGDSTNQVAGAEIGVYAGYSGAQSSALVLHKD
jgi:acetyl-CoA acetyltransferase